MPEGRPSSRLESFTHGFADWAGTGSGFGAAVASLLAWLAAGHWLHYSASWENALSVYVAVITFLMIFLMQRAQKKDLLALHIKLNELIAATGGADNRLINIEKQTEDALVRAHEAHEEKAPR